MTSLSGWKDGADVKLTAQIAEGLDEVSPFVTGWTLIVTYNDTDGDDCVAFNSMAGQTRNRTIGHLAHAMEVERASIFWDERPE